jgi:putative DNA primase/helicase
VNITTIGGVPAYVHMYIRRALREETLEAQPDKAQAGKYFPALEAIYETHRSGGPEAVASVYNGTITASYPELVEAVGVQPSSNGSGNGGGGDDEDPSWTPDDDEIALAIAEEWDDEIAHIYGDWHIYQDGYWQERHDAEIHRHVRKQLRRFRSRGVKVSQARIKAIASMLSDDMYIPDRDIIRSARERARYIPLKNGLYNVDALQMEESRPELYIMEQLDFEFDPRARCDNFLRYLQTSLVIPGTTAPDDDMIAFVQEAIGYSMTAYTDKKASFWLVGEPDSGKSTLVSFLRDLLGGFHATIDLNTLGQSKFMLGHIVGKRAVTFTEAESNAVLPDGLYKALVGGSDEIFADVKNKPGISFVPEAKLWWAMNNSPRNMDRSGAMLNRLRPVLFPRSIPKNERIAGLGEILRRERPGVFNWAMVGYRRLVETGKFTESVSASRWKEDYRKENDTELSFIEDMMIREPNADVSSQELYDVYRSWCDRNGFRAKNINQVTKDWLRLGLEKINRKNYRYWSGVRFRADVE